jgi:hypothetical protein
VALPDGSRARVASKGLRGEDRAQVFLTPYRRQLIASCTDDDICRPIYEYVP